MERVYICPKCKEMMISREISKNEQNYYPRVIEYECTNNECKNKIIKSKLESSNEILPIFPDPKQEK